MGNLNKFNCMSMSVLRVPMHIQELNEIVSSYCFVAEVFQFVVSSFALHCCIFPTIQKSRSWVLEEHVLHLGILADVDDEFGRSAEVYGLWCW